MSHTPVFDSLLEQYPSIWTVSAVFPLPVEFAGLPEYSMDGTSKADIRNAVRAGEPIPRVIRDYSETPEPHITFIKEHGAWENAKGIIRGALSILTPTRAPHLWP